MRSAALYGNLGICLYVNINTLGTEPEESTQLLPVGAPHLNYDCNISAKDIHSPCGHDLMKLRVFKTLTILHKINQINQTIWSFLL